MGKTVFIIVILLVINLCFIPNISYSQQTNTAPDQSYSEITVSIIAGLSAIGGALVGGFFTYFVTMKIEDKKEKKEKAEFDRYRKGLIKCIDSELKSHQKFTENSLSKDGEKYLLDTSTIEATKDILQHKRSEKFRIYNKSNLRAAMQII